MVLKNLDMYILKPSCQLMHSWKPSRLTPRTFQSQENLCIVISWRKPLICPKRPRNWVLIQWRGLVYHQKGREQAACLGSILKTFPESNPWSRMTGSLGQNPLRSKAKLSSNLGKQARWRQKWSRWQITRNCEVHTNPTSTDVKDWPYQMQEGFLQQTPGPD